MGAGVCKEDSVVDCGGEGRAAVEEIVIQRRERRSGIEEKGEKGKEDEEHLRIYPILLHLSAPRVRRDCSLVLLLFCLAFGIRFPRF